MQVCRVTKLSLVRVRFENKANSANDCRMLQTASLAVRLQVRNSVVASASASADADAAVPVLLVVLGMVANY